jgi:hypothetical protein
MYSLEQDQNITAVWLDVSHPTSRLQRSTFREGANPTPRQMRRNRQLRVIAISEARCFRIGHA